MIKVVKEWPEASTIMDVRSFVGFISYYRRFIKDFSNTANPLKKLLGNVDENQVKASVNKSTVDWSARGF